MEMKEYVKDEVLVLDMTGELMGGDETEQFQERIYRTIRDGVVSVVVNMKEIKWMNSSGLGMIMSGLTTLRGSGGDLRLANVTERVRRPIEVTKLDKVIRIYDSVDEAVKSFESGG
jgi:anti-sigma B factor antagonist